MHLTPQRARISFMVVAFLVSGIGLTAALGWGPLNPPAGPVAPTAKPIAEVEPRTAINATNTPGDNDGSPSLFKITQPGSYYLTGNITGVVGKHGIEIAASGVTLDLNGFDLVGVPAMGAFDGVSVTVIGLSNIAVVNGSVRNWGDEGVDLESFASTNGRIDGVRASGNAGRGISVGRGSMVSDCTAYQNGVDGIATREGSTVSVCTAHDNIGDGISTLLGSTVTNCTAYRNTGNGINTSFSNTITNCTAYLNTAHGINANGSCTISNCTANSNTLNGIDTGSASTLSNCTAITNVGNGIDVGDGCTVANCTSRSNQTDGIVCSSSCVILGNTCSNNGTTANGAGIRVTGADSRIEGNNCIGADLGIVLLGAGNVMFKNTCSGNTINFDIFTGNRYGPIINITAANPATVSGNTAASTMGSTDPWANFAY